MMDNLAVWLTIQIPLIIAIVVSDVTTKVVTMTTDLVSDQLWYLHQYSSDYHQQVTRQSYGAI